MEEFYFVWDERKRQANIKKHGVDFADVTGIFYDDDTIVIEDPELHDEQRYIARKNARNLQVTHEKTVRF